MPILSHLLFQPSPAKSSASEPQGMRAPVDHKIVGGFHPPHEGRRPAGSVPRRSLAGAASETDFVSRGVVFTRPEAALWTARAYGISAKENLIRNSGPVMLPCSVRLISFRPLTLSGRNLPSNRIGPPL